ncbi:MAG: ACP S-malonyltransferase [Chloroflexi bacterium]|nr:MAG: ACP S-malonyltransferase [Chloroflexota bacterium]
MARDLLEGDPGSADFLRQAEDRLAMPLGRLMVEGPEAELQATENAQPAILFHSLALLRRLVTNGIEPGAVAGHSMGEFAGLVAGGALDPLDALVAVRARGAAMSAAAPPASGMIAVLGLPDDTVEQICAASEGLVVVANYNAPGQVVISGSESGLNAVSPKLQAAGAKRLVRLPGVCHRLGKDPAPVAAPAPGLQCGCTGPPGLERGAPTYGRAAHRPGPLDPVDTAVAAARDRHLHRGWPAADVDRAGQEDSPGRGGPQYRGRAQHDRLPARRACRLSVLSTRWPSSPGAVVASVARLPRCSLPPA